MFKKLTLLMLSALSLFLTTNVLAKPKSQLVPMESGPSPYWIRIYTVKKLDSATLESCKKAGCVDGIEVILAIGSDDAALMPPVFSDRFYFTIDGVDYRDSTIQEMGKAIRERLTWYSLETIGTKNPDVARAIAQYNPPNGSYGILHILMPGGTIKKGAKLGIRYRLSNKNDSSIDYQFSQEFNLKNY